MNALCIILHSLFTKLLKVSYLMEAAEKSLCRWQGGKKRDGGPKVWMLVLWSPEGGSDRYLYL
jgi:hypothetical protein